MKGNCRICGEYKKLTFEHTPPQSAFNKNPVFIQTHEHLHNESSYVYGKRFLSNRGAGAEVLCAECNKMTGSFYGNSYKEFAYQAEYALNHQVWSLESIPFNGFVQPLNTLKQIMTMFLAIDSSGSLRGLDGLVEFIKNKELKSLPSDLRLFMYLTSSITIRNGWSNMNDGTGRGSVTTGEITFRPLGFVYTLKSLPVRKDLIEITEWQDFDYNEKVGLELSIPYLVAKSYIPWFYK